MDCDPSRLVFGKWIDHYGPLNSTAFAGVTENEVRILRKVKELGAALEEDLVVSLDRFGEDLRPELENLKKRANS